MNDFTQEELINLHYAVERCIETNCNDEFEIKLYSLLEKINSILDNYEVIKPPTIKSYCCSKCNEEWRNCDCRYE